MPSNVLVIPFILYFSYIASTNTLSITARQLANGAARVLSPVGYIPSLIFVCIQNVFVLDYRKLIVWNRLRSVNTCRTDGALQRIQRSCGPWVMKSGGTAWCLVLSQRCAQLWEVFSVPHKKHISKVMAHATVGFYFNGSPENGGEGLLLHF